MTPARGSHRVDVGPAGAAPAPARRSWGPRQRGQPQGVVRHSLRHVQINGTADVSSVSSNYGSARKQSSLPPFFFSLLLPAQKATPPHKIHPHILE